MADEVARESFWTREQDRAFEDALVAYPDEGSEDRWEKIANNVAGKSVEEIKHHYGLLIDDLDRIESGIVPLPCYSASSDDSASHGGDDGTRKKGGNSGHCNSESFHGCKAASKADQERRKGVAWTEDEHRLFLLGLEKYGKGDWRSISRNFVVTRTPTQVASHAQKYFIRLNSMNRDRRRSSIHDITSVSNGDASAHQAAITGQTNASIAGKSSNQSPQVTSEPSSSMVSVYGGTVGLAVGTPVNLPPPLPPPPPPHMAYGIRAPGHVVPGAPMNVSPMTYPMLKTSSRR